MTDQCLLDAGAIVTALEKSNRHCADFQQVIGRYEGHLHTSEPCLVEASYLLGKLGGFPAQESLFVLLKEAGVTVHCANERLSKLHRLMERYRDLPMDLADATLVDLAEQLSVMRVITTDRRDFSVYRVGRRSFELLGAVP